MVNIEEKDSYIEANKKGYNDSDPGVWSTIKGITDANRQFACHHKFKTAAVVVGTFLAVAGIFAYFASAAYAAYVIAAGAKAAALVSPAVTAVSAFLVANPLIASLIIAASVVALVAAPVYAYMSNSKASQIEEAGKLLNDSDPASKINQIKEVLGFAPAPAK